MSPKNKGKFGKGKSAVEPDDEFLSTMSRVGKALEPHVKKIVLGVVAITVLLIGVFGWRYYSSLQEQKATVIYAKALTLADVPVYEPPPDPTTDPTADPTADAADGQAPADGANAGFVPEDRNNDGLPDSFPTRMERAKAVMEHLDELRSEYGSTDVASGARLLRASMLYDLGRYQAAYDTYRAFARSSVPDALETLAREGMGHASEALASSVEDANQKKAFLEQALESYRSIQEDASGPEWDRAVYHAARIKVALGQTDQAKQDLRQALESVPDGPMSEDIKHYLAQLEAGK